MTSKTGRTQRCDAAQARTRLADAHAQLGLGGLANAASAPEERKAATACAVVAGIAAKQFGRLVGIKDAAQYGFDDISESMLLAAQRQARALVEFAEAVLAR